MTLNQAIRKRILNLAKENNLTINGFANKCGIAPSTIRNITDENNKDTKISTILKICQGLDIELDDFFSDKLFRNLRSID